MPKEGYTTSTQAFLEDLKKALITPTDAHTHCVIEKPVLEWAIAELGRRQQSLEAIRRLAHARALALHDTEKSLVHLQSSYIELQRAIERHPEIRRLEHEEEEE